MSQDKTLSAEGAVTTSHDRIPHCPSIARMAGYIEGIAYRDNPNAVYDAAVKMLERVSDAAHAEIERLHQRIEAAKQYAVNEPAIHDNEARDLVSLLETGELPKDD